MHGTQHDKPRFHSLSEKWVLLTKSALIAKQLAPHVHVFVSIDTTEVIYRVSIKSFPDYKHS